MPKQADSVILGLHADDTLNVFIRNEGNLYQAAKFATHNGVSPAIMTAVMADLADAFGWRQIAATSSEVPQPEPAARVLPTPSREVRSAAADRTSTLALPPGMTHNVNTRAIYHRIIAALDAAGSEGLRFGALHSVVGRGRSSGQVYGYLSVLVKRKLVIRPEEGLYVAIRQGAVPVDGVLTAKTADDGPVTLHPAGKMRRSSNLRHSVTIEDVIAFVAKHPEGVQVARIGDALMPGEHERGHTISNRLLAYDVRVKRTGEARQMHKVVTTGSHGKMAMMFPGPPPP
jgi:hypothetical protein